MYIGVHHHRVTCRIGILPEEQENDQDIFVDIKIKVKDQAEWDSLEKTISYVDLADVCTQLAKKNNYGLLEQMAQDVLQALAARFPIDWAWIKIKKPKAIPSAEFAYVELEHNAQK